MSLQEASLHKSSTVITFCPLFAFLIAHPHSEPTVFENYVHDIYVDDQLVELSLWDTAGTLVAPLFIMHVLDISL
jgi:GTPase SAR1 family protein